MNRVIHFEINADDPERAATFYRDVLGWCIQKWDGPIPYWLVGTGEGEPGINGGIKHRTGHLQTVNSVVVADIDAILAKVVEHGGTVVRPPEPIPGLGRHAYFADTEGNVTGLIQYNDDVAPMG
jgi:predicted enzyme related to lactoylglutathione lyase